MKLSLSTLALVTAFALSQAALAADKPAAKKSDCAEVATMPQAKSEKSRADVKAEAKAGAMAGTECEASPAPVAKSTKARAAVKEETKKAMKEGELSKGEASTMPKK
jgi:Tfp pilus assembly protein PilV